MEDIGLGSTVDQLTNIYKYQNYQGCLVLLLQRRAAAHYH